MLIGESFRARIAELASRGVYVGTSSWKYEGWIGLLYDEQRYVFRKKFSKKRFDEHCLVEYAETFKTVSVDGTFYQFPNAKLLDRLMGSVPSDFKFALKATSDITLKHFPRLPQHGVKAGKANAHFLDAGLFERLFLTPCAAFRDRVGVVMLEFSQFRREDYAHGREFVIDLDRFLGKLPSGWNFAVEIRNRNFLQPEYLEVLARHGVAHVFNQWTRMPPVQEQMKMPGSQPSDFLVARFLLACGRTFEEAVAQFSPYTETREINHEGRAAGRGLIAQAQKRGRRPSFIFVNNRFEGNSPRTIQAMVE